jgi:hypothetical protein
MREEKHMYIRRIGTRHEQGLDMATLVALGTSDSDVRFIQMLQHVVTMHSKC